jgi:hypothetical protein
MLAAIDKPQACDWNREAKAPASGSARNSWSLSRPHCIQSAYMTLSTPHTIADVGFIQLRCGRSWRARNSG